METLETNETISLSDNENEQPGTSTSSSISLSLDEPALFDGTFYRIIEKGPNFSIKAQCQKCTSVIKYIKGRSNATSNFLKHIRTIHKNEYEEYLQYRKTRTHAQKRKISSNDAGSADLKKSKLKKQLDIKSSLTMGSKVSQENFDKKLVKFITNSMSALSIIENETFVDLFKGFDVKIISRKTAVRRISELSNETIINIKKILEDVEFVCTTADIWSSKKRSFLGMTCHWIDSINYERRSAALACRRFSGSHSFDRIAELIDEIHSKFSINGGKVCATVTDNGSNFLKAFKEYGIGISNSIILNSIAPSYVDFEETDEINSYPIEENSNNSINSDDDLEDLLYLPNSENMETLQLPKHLRCISHTINLLATTDLMKLINSTSFSRSRHTNIMNKCSQLWNKAGRPKSAEIIMGILGHTLSYPGITRWNSHYDAITQILSEKEKLPILYEELFIKQHSLKENEIEYLIEYVEVLKPLALALDILQGEKNMFYGFVIPTIASLDVKLKKIKGRNLKYFSSVLDGLLQAVLRRFNSYFTFENLDALLAVISHPSFKLKWITMFHAIDNFESIKANVKTNFIKAVVATSSENNKDEKLNEEPTNTPLNNFFEFGDRADELHNEYNDDSSSTSTRMSFQIQGGQAELEALQYLQDPGTNLEILNKYPLVKKVFIKYNCPLPSSAPVERMFSYATFINSPRRHALSDQNFENLVILKANDKYL